MHGAFVAKNLGHREKQFISLRYLYKNFFRCRCVYFTDYCVSQRKTKVVKHEKHNFSESQTFISLLVLSLKNLKSSS